MKILKTEQYFHSLTADISVLDQYSSQPYHQKLQESTGENWKILANRPDILKILTKYDSTALHQLLIDRLNRPDKRGRARF